MEDADLEDEFQILEQIGDGATCKVFKGKYDNSPCAIKIVDKSIYTMRRIF